MSLTYLEWNCPMCGKKNREDTNSFAYGTPIRHCRYCGGEYLDRRWTEIAVEGADKRSTTPKIWFIASLVMLLIAVFSWFSMYNLYLGGRYSVKNIGTAIITSIFAIVFFFCSIYIKHGGYDEKNEMYMRESEERLKDPTYVQKLIYYGYDVPEKYR